MSRIFLAQNNSVQFRKEWENSQPEIDMIRVIVDALTSQNLTQTELSKRTEKDDA